ncbi:MAG: cation-translocating P-type ATPase [Nitrososphaeraceae archaeon]
MDFRDWHTLSSSEIYHLFKTNIQTGLSKEEILKRQESDGPNIISKKKETTKLELLLSQFKQPFVYILVIAGFITAILQEWIDASVIFGVVIVNTLVGFIQEYKAGKAIDALSKIIITESTVIREKGKKITIPSQQLVVGDIVILKSGDKVPADIRLIKTRELKIDESSLTGESIPIEKNAKVLKLDTILADRHNIAFAGTLVTYGQGIGVIVNIGNKTETGKISESITSVEHVDTPLSRKLSGLSKLLLVIIGGLVALTFSAGISQNHPFIDMFMFSVAIAVAAIPEGLPAALTIALSIGVSRMAKSNAIIRKLPAVETLGSTTVICSDKTGTLTENQMTVTEIVAGGSKYNVTGIGYIPEGNIIFKTNIYPVDKNSSHQFPESNLSYYEEMPIKNTLSEFIFAGVLCNDSQLIKDEETGHWKIKGDPTEGSLLVLAKKVGYDEHILNKKFPRLDSIPFESHLRYMATIHYNDISPGNVSADKDFAKKTIYVKGSLGKILRMCTAFFYDVHDRLSGNIYRQIQELSPEITEIIKKQSESMAKKGLRIIAFAKKEVLDENINEISHSDIESDLIFLGFVAMIDPPRKDVIESISSCHTAGIDVKMITGDNLHTAVAIAKQLGLRNITHQSINKNDIHYNKEYFEFIKKIGPDHDNVTSNESIKAITGNDLEQYSELELVNIAENISVFARVSPNQKLSLVRALQKKGHVVAMTGDGVNDAPALKQADIGIAMGSTGTDVAKESSDMILTDDNFASIKTAVEEGRGIFDNLIKFIAWTLPTNIGEAIIVIAAFFTGLALPMIPIQILWINMATALTLGLMLIFEPKEKDIMKRPPRPPKYSLINKEMMERILITMGIMAMSVYFLFTWELNISNDLDLARTVSVNTLVMIEITYLLNSRSLYKSILKLGIFSNKWIIIGIIMMLLLQLLYTYTPQMNLTFESTPMNLESWLRIIIISIISYFIIEIYKKIRTKKNHSTYS